MEGDYICYKVKNELGKVKKVQDETHVFAWFHCGDTASRISKNDFEVILSSENARKISQSSVIQLLQSMDFSNAYAIESIVKKEQ